jgi:hypothetical protein
MLCTQADEERTFKILQQCTRKIRELGDRGRAKDAIQELASLSNQNVQPDTYAATALVRACCKDMELAQSVFDELFGGCNLHGSVWTLPALVQWMSAGIPVVILLGRSTCL